MVDQWACKSSKSERKIDDPSFGQKLIDAELPQSLLPTTPWLSQERPLPPMPASIRRNLLLKGPTFLLSSTSLPTSSQCSPKTSPSLSIWATCPLHGGSFLLLPFLWPGQLLKNKDVNKHDGTVKLGEVWVPATFGPKGWYGFPSDLSRPGW